jgi:hypothetical protein
LRQFIKGKKVITGIGGALAEVSGEYSYGFDATNNSHLITALNNLDKLNVFNVNKVPAQTKYSWREAAKKLYHIIYETSQNSY